MDSYFSAGHLEKTTLMDRSTVEKLIPSFSDVFVSTIDGISTDLKMINESPKVVLSTEGVTMSGVGYMHIKNTLNPDLSVVQLNYTFTALLIPEIGSNFKLKG